MSRRLKSWERVIYINKNKKHRDKYWSGCTFETRMARDGCFLPPFSTPFPPAPFHAATSKAHYCRFQAPTTYLILWEIHTGPYLVQHIYIYIGGIRDHPLPPTLLLLLFRETVAAATNNALYIYIHIYNLFHLLQ